MRVTKEEMDQNHQRIVQNASALIREWGIENTSVAAIMREAGLTHGGFYRHFDSKDALMIAALKAAFDEGLSALDARFEKHAPQAAVAAHQSNYLGKGHIENPQWGCPMPTLAREAALGSDAMKAAFGEGLRRTARTLARGMTGTEAEKRDQALRRIALLAGAVMLARGSDAETAAQLLSACRKA